MSRSGDGVAVDIAQRWEDVGGQPHPTGYVVYVNGAALPCPVAAYEVAEGDRGPLVLLTVPADRVSVAQKPPVAVAAGRSARTWGAPGPDPRDGFPGWAPKAVNGDA